MIKHTMIKETMFDADYYVVFLDESYVVFMGKGEKEMKKIITVENMMRTFALDQCRLKTWDTFKTMHYLGFITDKEWERFYDECKKWECYQNPPRVIDADEKLIYNFETGEGSLNFRWDRI